MSQYFCLTDIVDIMQDLQQSRVGTFKKSSPMIEYQSWKYKKNNTFIGFFLKIFMKLHQSLTLECEIVYL